MNRADVIKKTAREKSTTLWRTFHSHPGLVQTQPSTRHFRQLVARVTEENEIGGGVVAMVGALTRHQFYVGAFFFFSFYFYCTVVYFFDESGRSFAN